MCISAVTEKFTATSSTTACLNPISKYNPFVYLKDVGGILDGIADTEEKRKKYLLAVQTRTADLEKLVDQLSSYNRMENHAFRYEMEEYDLKEFVLEYLSENEDLPEKINCRFLKGRDGKPHEDG